MQKGRKQNICQPVNGGLNTVDKAYNSYVNEQKKVNALKNRNKAIQLNEDRILKRFQNNIIKLQKISNVKEFQKEKSEMLSLEKIKKQRLVEELKFINQYKRKQHQRQMSNVFQSKNEQANKLREQAKRNRKEYLKIIQKNREQQSQLKKQHHNKVHKDLMESRNTIKHFFHSKHENIIKNNQNQIQNLQIKRSKVLQQLENEADLQQKAKKLSQMKAKLKQQKFMKDTFTAKCQRSNDGHPLVKRIEQVMSKYVKYN